MGQRNMLGKGLEILQYLVEHSDRGCGVTEVANAVGVPVSTAHRLLATLVASSWAARSEGSTKYRLGPQVLRAADALHTAMGLPDLHASLASLAQRTGETAILGTVIGGEFIYLDVVHGPGLLGIKGSPGQRGPLHCTATGKALLCALPSVRREQLIDQLELTEYTENTITDHHDLRAELQLSMSRGYALAREEYEEGVISIAIPLALDQEGAYAACISAPAQRVTAERIPALHQALVETQRGMRASSEGATR
ncbi:IclR family transcriptional regulator [Parenemella sanctibonifatiensis]|uniref:IclR family transcriptional regulator n=1 Tax=Parenemella sanctibonifatiensis TaxID=2016505 RepID=A0A255DXQ7_9ACTN|nr:IclR family transcriptional regulator [Parenemella sanctibonifatiensis]OYN84096.1 hypothetical protein CGZ92_13680 [Parenemella sanctibonifatiensis]